MKFSVAAIILHKGEYLFQKRDNKKSIFYPNFYGLFGGTSKIKEKPIETIKRELNEEISLNFNKIEYFISIKLDSKRFNPKNSSEFKRYFFVCTLPFNFNKELILKEGQSYKFLNINKINKLKIAPFDYAVVKFHSLLKSNAKIIPRKYFK